VSVFSSSPGFVVRAQNIEHPSKVERVVLNALAKDAAFAAEFISCMRRYFAIVFRSSRSTAAGLI
jgi:hypothetical protein